MFSLAETIRALRQSPAFPHLRGLFFEALSAVSDYSDEECERRRAQRRHAARGRKNWTDTSAYDWMGGSNGGGYSLWLVFWRIAWKYGMHCQVCGLLQEDIQTDFALHGIALCQSCASAYARRCRRKDVKDGENWELAFVAWLSELLLREGKASRKKAAIERRIP